MRRPRAERLAALAAFATLSGCAFLPAGATQQAREMHQVWVVFLWTAVAVGVIVYGLIAWCLIRWRDRGRDDGLPQQWSNHVPLELTWTAIPLVLVMGLFAYTYFVERNVQSIVADPALTVNVTGFRWSWRFDYPSLDVAVEGSPSSVPQLVLPVDQVVAFNVTSTDVDHSFWVPAFLFKRDAIPGLMNHFDWTPAKLGLFRGECGEYCGLQHADMVFTVRVVTPAAFRRWIVDHHGSAVAFHPLPARAP